ncbi:MAG: urea carboxylase-associated protein [Halobacteriovoraceae bacterium]|nr:urea carboxylase-associated protein [Halobacteriovoraceae bacterium]|tara:strand:- start:65433 stop:66008 length:576 start_codon:yes stop_codon:yes gene_type:complete
MKTIEPRHGVGFILKKGEKLKVVDPQGEQVSDFFCLMQDSPDEYLSSGRTIDYLSKIYMEKGDTLYSSKSRAMCKIVEDTCGRHDFLLTPCSKDTFRIIYGDKDPHQGCEGNLIEAFSSLGVELGCLPTTLNLFMNVQMREDGKIDVRPPKSQAGDYVVIEALEDLLVGLTACSALDSNNGSFKPIDYEII